MEIIWQPKALAQAEEYADYIALDSPIKAKKWLNDLFEEVKRLEAFPKSARVVPESNNENIREIIFKRFRIIYELGEVEINILSVRRFKQNFDPNDL